MGIEVCCIKLVGMLIIWVGRFVFDWFDIWLGWVGGMVYVWVWVGMFSFYRGVCCGDYVLEL